MPARRAIQRDGEVYITTGMAAKCIPLNVRLISRMFDEGRFSGFKIPSPSNSNRNVERRIKLSSLRAFAEEYGIPFEEKWNE